MMKLKKLLEGMAWERTPGKPLPTLKDVTEKHNKTMNEAISLKVGDEYSVMDYGDGEFRDGLKYLGFSRNEKSHVFSGPDGAPGSNEVILMFVEKGDEETHVSDVY